MNFDTLKKKLEALIDGEYHTYLDGHPYVTFSEENVDIVFHLYGKIQTLGGTKTINQKLVGTKVKLDLSENTLDSYKVSIRLARANWITLSSTGIRTISIHNRGSRKKYTKKESVQTELPDF